MEKFDLSQLGSGEKLLVTTETGSIYHLLAENAPVPVGSSDTLFSGLRATRESDHQITGRPELIENEPAIVAIRSGEADGVLRAGDFMEIIWDRHHPESKTDWDIQFGLKFHPLSTSRIVNIEFVPIPNQE